jgi:hypothetical protein
MKGWVDTMISEDVVKQIKDVTQADNRIPFVLSTLLAD